MANQIPLSINAATDNEIIAAPGANQIIQIWGMVGIAAGAVSMTIKSGTTSLTGAMPLSASNGFSAWSGHGQPILECAPNEALKITLSAAVLVAGWLIYSIKGPR